jgi:hypothetical protein
MRRRAGKDLREIKVSAPRFGAVSLLDADGISNYEGVTFSSKHNINGGWGKANARRGDAGSAAAGQASEHSKTSGRGISDCKSHSFSQRPD